MTKEIRPTPAPWSDWDQGSSRYLDAGQHNLGKPVAEFFGPDREVNRALVKDCVSAFDSAAARLGRNAVELAEWMRDGGIADLVEALKALLGDRPQVQGGVCQHCGRDYIGDMLEGDCPAEECPAHVACVAISKAEGRPIEEAA